MIRSICIALLTGICALSVHAQKKTGVAPTPPMGWNSWNYFHCDVSETLIMEMADAMLTSGMKEAGYEYVVIDDCWQVGRDENGKIIADPERFPSGMKALADYIHSLGLKFGIYSDAGRKTCQERPGSCGYETIDAETYEEWGVDYLKYDWCHNGLFNTSKEVYPVMSAAIAGLERPIVFSMCNWGRQQSWKWAGEYAHLWRTTLDIKPEFSGPGVFRKSVLRIIDQQRGLSEYAGPDGWNDPDMLQVGNGDLTYDENVAHFSMWCMLAAPLMAGNDLRNMPEDVVGILTKSEAIVINQDPLGKQGYRLSVSGKVETWVKPLSGGAWAICLLNKGRKASRQTLEPGALLSLKGAYSISDIWAGSTVEENTERIDLTLPGHGVVLLRLDPM